jgi:hypothetical protein
MMRLAIPGPRNMPSRLSRLLKSLARDRSGISLVEFALSLPLVVTLGMFGMEIAFMATANMQVSQLALAVADNASRLGQTDNSAVTPTISEDSINAVMQGAKKQGESLNLEQNGRIILSSLEKDAGTGKQYIHWQRCFGALDRDSSYGNDTTLNGLNGPNITGLGKPGRQVTARDGQAVMYAEIYYTYQPLFGDMFIGDVTFKQEAGFVVRDDRNLSGGGGDGITGTATSTC